MSGCPSWKSVEVAYFTLFLLFCSFLEGAMRGAWEIQKTEEKGLSPQISSDRLNPNLLNPHLRHSKKLKPCTKVKPCGCIRRIVAVGVAMQALLKALALAISMTSNPTPIVFGQAGPRKGMVVVKAQCLLIAAAWTVVDVSDSPSLRQRRAICTRGRTKLAQDALRVEIPT